MHQNNIFLLFCQELTLSFSKEPQPSWNMNYDWKIGNPGGEKTYFILMRND